MYKATADTHMYIALVKAVQRKEIDPTSVLRYMQYTCSMYMYKVVYECS